MNWKYFCDGIRVFLHGFTNADVYFALGRWLLLCQLRNIIAKVARRHLWGRRLPLFHFVHCFGTDHDLLDNNVICFFVFYFQTSLAYNYTLLLISAGDNSPGRNSLCLFIIRIRVGIDPPHPLMCRKRRINWAVLRMRPEKPRPRVTAGVAR
jgi:hypothetical protein